MYKEDNYLMISGIQHYVFCKRQWSLIHIEQQWAENYRTVDGTIMHENAHNADFREKRGDKVIVRSMAVSSPTLGVSGECDVVEFKKSNKGIAINNLDGKYTLTPIEYKRGEPKENRCDEMQLMAQTLCLEEMLCCEIEVGYLYYGENKRRTKVVFDSELRQKTIDTISEMHQLFDRKHTPKVKRSKACNACSLKNICLPVICGNKKASTYISDTLGKDDEK